jgi:acetoin utilization deacetylase AcuC-like enzyme
MTEAAGASPSPKGPPPALPTLVFSDPLFLEHRPGPGHPERPDRVKAIVDDFAAHPVAGVERRPPRPATEKEILAVHSAAYLETLKATAGRTVRLDPDTVASPSSYDAARLAAGGTVAAVEAVWSRSARNAFVWARPPGHHAEQAEAMGFCLLNNVAIAAEAGRRLGAQRVLIVDWDVHHGNGTQHLFEKRRDVLFASSHQYPFYPGTGAPEEVGLGEGAGFTVNCGLPPGTDDADFAAVFHDLFLPIAQAYRPDLVLVSAGFDAHARDPLGEMKVSERGFAAMCSALKGIAEASAGGKLVLVLEGGYDLSALAGSSRACLEVMTGRKEEFPSGTRRSPQAVQASRAALRKHWRL